MGSTELLFPGTWYLTHIDDMHRRRYERKPISAEGATKPVMQAADLKKAEMKVTFSAQVVERQVIYIYN